MPLVRRQAKAKRQGVPRFTEPALKELEPKVVSTAVSKAEAIVAAAIATLIPVGAMFPYAGSTAPPGYLLCQGQTISAATYPQLAAVIGTSFGGTAANPRLPDVKGRAVVGVGLADASDSTSAWLFAQKFGTETHTLVNSQMPSHAHGLATGTAGFHDHGGTTGNPNTSNHNHDVRYNLQTNTATGGTSNRVTGITVGGSETDTTANNSVPHTHTIPNQAAHDHSIASTGGDAAHNNIQPSLAMNWIIKT